MAGAAASLEVDLAGLRLATPIVLAAGTCGTLDEMDAVLDLRHVGAVTTKSISRLPREGNPGVRVAPLAVGMLNAIGLANPGLESFMRDYAPRVASLPVPVIGSIAGFCVEDYVEVARAFESIEAMPAVEINVSCPNVHGGTEFGSDVGALRELVGAVRRELKATRLIVKLSPIVSGKPTIIEVAAAAIDAGADALTLANTIPAMAIDVETREPLIGNVTGGLSGPAVHPAAVKLVHDVYRGVAREAGVPIIGLGGVNSWRDAAEMILTGATAVGVGTATLANVRSPVRLRRGLEAWVRRQGAASIRELVGAVRLSPRPR